MDHNCPITYKFAPQLFIKQINLEYQNMTLLIERQKRINNYNYHLNHTTLYVLTFCTRCLCAKMLVFFSSFVTRLVHFFIADFGQFLVK